MEKKVEINYLKTLLEEIKRSLKTYNRSGEQDCLHDFRVGVKKMKAFLILADSDGHKSKLLKKFRPVGRIFRRAGKIRNAAINKQLCGAIASEVLLQTAPHAIEEKFKRKYRRYTQVIKKAGRRIETSIQPINDAHIFLFYEAHLQQIASFFIDVDFTNSLHECRKQIKILLYNYSLAGPLLDIKLNEQYLDELQEAIGDWHDLVIAANDDTENRLSNSTVFIKELVQDFYERATTVVDLPLEQID